MMNLALLNSGSRVKIASLPAPDDSSAFGGSAARISGSSPVAAACEQAAAQKTRNDKINTSLRNLMISSYLLT